MMDHLKEYKVKTMGCILSATLLSSLSIAAVGANDSTIVKTEACTVSSDKVMCDYKVNSAKAVTAIGAVIDGQPDRKSTSTLYKDMDGDKSFTWILNIIDFNRDDSRSARDQLMKLIGGMPAPVNVAVFTSDGDGLNVIGVQSDTRQKILLGLGDWKSPPISQSAVNDLISTLKVAGASTGDHKGFQWITTGLTLSKAQIDQVVLAVKQSGVRFSAVQLLASESDLNRFAGIKQITQSVGGYYQGVKLSNLSDIGAATGFYRNGATVSVPTKGLCGPQKLSVTFKIDGKDYTKSEDFKLPACPKPEPKPEPKPDVKPVEKADSKPEKKNDPKPDVKPEPDKKEDQKKVEKPKKQVLPKKTDPNKQADPKKQADTDKKAGTDVKKEEPKKDTPKSDGKVSDKGKDVKKDTAKDTKKEADKKGDVKASTKEDDQKNMMMIIAGVIGLILVIIVIMIMRKGRAVSQAVRNENETAKAFLSGQLTISGDGAEDRNVPLGGSSMRIGRSNENDIVIHDDAVSGFHALIRAEANGMITYTDLNSTNGSIMDNREITTVQLMGGEHIRIGSTVLTYEA